MTEEMYLEVNNKANDFCEKEKQKLKGTLTIGQTETLMYKAYKNGAIDFHSKCIAKLKEEIQNLEGIKLAQETALSKEYIIEEQLQSEQIEKMKCCQNCKNTWNGYRMNICEDCSNNSKWGIKEKK